MKLSEPVPQSYYEILRFINYAMYANHRGFDVVILKKSPCGNTAQACPLFGGGIFDGLYARKTLFAILKDARRISADSSELWEEWHDMDNFSERYRFFQLRFEAAVPDAQAMICYNYSYLTGRDRRDMMLEELRGIIPLRKLDEETTPQYNGWALCGFEGMTFEDAEELSSYYSFDFCLFSTYQGKCERVNAAFEPMDVLAAYQEATDCAVFRTVKEFIDSLRKSMLEYSDDEETLRTIAAEIQRAETINLKDDEFILDYLVFDPEHGFEVKKRTGMYAEGADGKEYFIGVGFW